MSILNSFNTDINCLLFGNMVVIFHMPYNVLSGRKHSFTNSALPGLAKRLDSFAARIRWQVCGFCDSKA